METNRFINAAGFFVSSITALALALLVIDYIRNYLISLFPFSFIVIIYFLSIYLRSRMYRHLEKPIGFLKMSWIVIPILGVINVFLFIYFGSHNITTYPLNNYGFNPYLITIAILWSVYSFIELVNVKRLSNRFAYSHYITISAVILVLISTIFLGAITFLLPIAFIIVSISSFFLGIKVYNSEEIQKESILIKKYKM